MTRPQDRVAGYLPSEETFLGYLFWLSRPRFWLYLAGPFLVGIVYGAPDLNGLLSPRVVALFLYFLIPANIFLYGINDRYDADIDEQNPKKSHEGKELRFRASRAVTATILSCGLVGLAFVAFLPVEAGIALVGFLLLGTAYSVPPVRFKTTPLLDSVSNGLYILPAVVGYTLLAGSLPPLVAIVGGWLWAMGMHTFSAIPDIEPDRAAGIRTTATVLGEDRTLAYCAGCWILAAISIGLLHPGFVLLFGIYPLFIASIIGFDINSSRAYWWFPVINSVAGAVITIAGLWVIVNG